MGGDTASREVSRILHAAEGGEPADMDALLPLVYDHLHGIAARQMAGERKGHTLQPTALVNEAYLRLVGRDALAWSSKAHFYGAAAEAMRRILVDHARKHASLKRGGGRVRAFVDLADLVVQNDPEGFLAVDEAILRLEGVDARSGSIVRLRIYAGLSLAEAAQALDLPQRTVERD
ncbi:MAG: ECF-type sigma factor, partial [Planctomycetota bacterium]|nr:ECF-type sigma factor [Planctomycetota bacterium]